MSESREYPKAKQDETCKFCGDTIKAGEGIINWYLRGDRDQRTPTHPECNEYLRKEGNQSDR